MTADNPIKKSSKRPNGYWNFDTLHAEALKYKTRQEFQQMNGAAYKAAGLLKLRDSICGHMVKIKNPKGYWTFENLRTEALKYDNKVDFRKYSNPAFLTASRNNILEEICNHMQPGKLPNGYWLVRENCATEALKYSNRRAFSLGNPSAYHGADKNNWLDDICSHMEFNPSSDGDAIYLWKAIDHMFNGLQIYKFGITSARLEDRRISEVANKASMKFEIVILTKITGPAAELESQLLKLGINPQYEGFNGASEFRALSDLELQLAIDLINRAKDNS